MARNLANHSYARWHSQGAEPIYIYNRTRSKSEDLLKELGDEKVKISDSAIQLAKACDVVITNLGSDEAVRSVYAQFKQALSVSQSYLVLYLMFDTLRQEANDSRSRIFVEMSTCFPSLAGELDEMISGDHTRLITCPVFGAPAAADKAQLVLVMSGDYRSKKEIAYLLCPAIGRKVMDLGGNLEKGK